MRPLRPVRPASTAGFSLTELLVVIGIVAVLSSLLLSAIPLLKTAARTMECASNLRQIGLAILTYAGDNSGNYPAHDMDDPSSWPYVIEDWAFRTYQSPVFGLQNGLYGGGCSFYDDYLPAGRRVYYCPEGLIHQNVVMADLRLSYPTFPDKPIDPQKARLSNYTYFAGTNEGKGNSRGGPRGTWAARARSTIISDLMRFGAAPYTQTSGAAWNHRGTTGTTTPTDLTARSGGHMFHADGRVAWSAGLDELLKHRQAMKGNASRSYCAEQSGDLP